MPGACIRYHERQVLPFTQIHGKMVQDDDYGWIKLHRKIRNNPFWYDKPFTKGQAWVDMLLLANYAESSFFKRGVRVDIKRGQLAYSQLALGELWGWSRKKVSCFLKMLEKEHQIVHQVSNVTTIITIVNYEQYQSKEQQTEHQKHNKGTHYKKNKNDNNKTDQINYENELNRNRPERRLLQ